MDFPPWPIPEWSWIIPTRSSEGLFFSPGSTLCWCNAPRLCFSDECAREGLRQEEGKLLPRLLGWMAGREEAQVHRCLQRKDWQLTLSTAKLTLSILLLSHHNHPLPPAPLPPVLSSPPRPSFTPEGSPLTPESSILLKLVPAATPPFLLGLRQGCPQPTCVCRLPAQVHLLRKGKPETDNPGSSSGPL